MHRVEVNKKLIMEGNTWDFHPGCHGITEYGNFNTPIELIEKITGFYLKKNYSIEIERKEYKYQWTPSWP